jgi:hypothetical protein
LASHKFSPSGRSARIKGLEELRPPFAEQHELRQSSTGCRFGLRALFTIILFCAVGLALARVVPGEFIFIGLAILGLVSFLSFALFGLRH